MISSPMMLGAFLALMLTAPTPRLVGGLELALPGTDAESKALSFFQRHRALFLPGDELSEVRVRRVVSTPQGSAVQMEQWVRGTRVFGKSLVVSLDGRERVRMAVNGLSPLVSPNLLDDLAPTSIAVERALSAFTSGGGKLRGDLRVETVWMQWGEWLEKIHLVTVPGVDPLGDFTYLVGGPEGMVVFVFPRMPMARGYAYPSNPLRGPYEEVELLYLTSSAHLNGEQVEVYNCAGSSEGSCTLQQLAEPDASGDYLIEPTGENDPDLPDDLFVEVQSYYSINTIHDYFIDVGFGATPINIAVNFPMPFNEGPNAFYSPQESAFNNEPAIVIGQWQDLDLAVENDVIFHEYGHHVFGQVSSTGMFDMDEYGPVFYGLAFNEATADYYSCSALEDPELGEYFASRMPMYFPKGYLRIVENDLTCPEGLYGEPHDDGMVWSGFLWEVRELIGSETADSLYMDVLAAFPASPDFPSATEVYLETAEQHLDATTVDQIRSIAERRGLTDCERFIPLSSSAHTGFAFGKEILGGYGDFLEWIPAVLHYFIELPENAFRLAIGLSTAPYRGVDVVLLVREDQPVTHRFGGMGLDSQYDFILEEGGRFDLLDPDPDRPFSPGHTYYFHPANRDQRTTEYIISGYFNASEPDGGIDGGADGGGDAGADGGVDGGDGALPDGGADGTPDSGCGCRTAAAAGATPTVWLVAATAFFIRRRRSFRRRRT